MYPPPASRTSHLELVGSMTAIILIVVVAALGLAVLIGLVFWADSHPGYGPRRPRTARAEPGEISEGQGRRPWERIEDRHVPEHGHPHGRPVSWALVSTVLAAFIVGALSLILHVWWLMATCGAIIVLAIPVGKGVGIMNDTIEWGSTAAADEDEAQELGGATPDRSSYADTR